MTGVPLSRPTVLAGAITALALSGCSVVAPEPVWELAKATAGVVSMAVASAPSKSSNTIRHFNGGLSHVCIRFNPDTQVPDIVPALQAELRLHSVDSRVYDTQVSAETCTVWLKYMAQIDWDTPPFASAYQPFVRQASLSLRSAQGQVLSTSQYQLDGGFSAGKWTSTREKLSPVVTALLTGVESTTTTTVAAVPAIRP
ncbi:cell division protein FtsI [Xylophilus sp. GOD-11R]|uniref:cell division protein FtsI n=1 Tax=Xylophilus sp. GOD-11R TaxID=3089814 RepID=UPI00298CF45B|nr:cell division protein FtsI [Xylophilus sp. GOD-11R]WPB55657.1 cell division protein FtsI [Xylophilus sp. GOD-11R]